MMPKYKITGKIIAEVGTNLELAADDDTPPSGETLAFLVQQDLLELHYDCDELEVIECTVEEVE